MHKIIILLALLALPACAEVTQAKKIVAQVGADAADQELQAAEWATCQAATIGAVRRKYGANRESAIAYLQFCNASIGIYPMFMVKGNGQ